MNNKCIKRRIVNYFAVKIFQLPYNTFAVLSIAGALCDIDFAVSHFTAEKVGFSYQKSGFFV